MASDAIKYYLARQRLFQFEPRVLVTVRVSPTMREILNRAATASNLSQSQLCLARLFSPHEAELVATILAHENPPPPPDLLRT